MRTSAVLVHHLSQGKEAFCTLLAVLLLLSNSYGQSFVKVTDTNNAIATASGPSGYSGASWVDFDRDGDLDLFVNNRSLFRNDGAGAFARVTTTIGIGQNLVTGNGNTWADYDNDGDLDVFVCSGQSFLYRNDGGTTFTQIGEGVIGESFANRGWSCAWADFNNDGYVDLAITHPAGFVPGTATTNHLFQNDGPPDFTFTRITSGPIVTGLAAYTVGTWSDFDQDGDVDYFVGAGPADGTAAPDFLYRNMLRETGSPDFTRITDGVIATDEQDGQVWNWIDYDNDGDLDAYLTNWGGGGGGTGMTNRLYNNDGGAFTRIASGAIVQDRNVSLSSVWGDFDNDGDVDCYVANDHGQQDRYYRNNGDGTFSAVAGLAIATSEARRGAAAGDYDNDGDLDLLTVGPQTAMALYRNDLADGHHWLKVKAVGTTSNRAAIGAKVRIQATLNGQTVWQLREVSAQNTFNGHNSLEVHVGLGDATVVDSLQIEWPSGIVDVYVDVEADQFLVATEGQAVSPVADEDEPALPDRFTLSQNHPNPFEASTTIRFSLPHPAFVTLTVYDVLGRVAAMLSLGPKETGWHDVRFDAGSLRPGLYLYRLQADGVDRANTMLLLK